jgi:hypothetical protein
VITYRYAVQGKYSGKPTDYACAPDGFTYYAFQNLRSALRFRNEIKRSTGKVVIAYSDGRTWKPIT